MKSLKHFYYPTVRMGSDCCRDSNCCAWWSFRSVGCRSHQHVRWMKHGGLFVSLRLF